MPDRSQKRQPVGAARKRQVVLILTTRVVGFSEWVIEFIGVRRVNFFGIGNTRPPRWKEVLRVINARKTNRVFVLYFGEFIDVFYAKRTAVIGTKRA